MKYLIYLLLFFPSFLFSQRVAGVFENDPNCLPSDKVTYLESRDTVIYKIVNLKPVLVYKGAVIRPFKLIDSVKQYTDVWRRIDTLEEI